MTYTYEELQAPENPYKAHGFTTRSAYLSSLTESFDVPVNVIFSLAQQLGRSEDFDGLISALEDYDSYEDYE